MRRRGQDVRASNTHENRRTSNSATIIANRGTAVAEGVAFPAWTLSLLRAMMLPRWACFLTIR